MQKYTPTWGVGPSAPAPHAELGKNLQKILNYHFLWCIIYVKIELVVYFIRAGEPFENIFYVQKNRKLNF